ncbi:MAG: tetratricopeptide repeat protein [Coleofasciculus sp. G1-WW12-02]|uniref:tetratricopeptide repeat protein n=1 Tax=unclassified Coleofasciculus TaxID=2692782 RepID=UPI0032F3C6E4
MSFDILFNYQGAIADYSQTIQIDPDYVEAYRDRGHILAAMTYFLVICESH